ncbi:MAG TPA: FAD-dependent oxidoreductase [Sporichthya sp.]|nr:FAD-dependent oxidoreductase [Sporichthya sp.]
MRVAVIGAGVFGATAAVELARTGAKVELFEARRDLLEGATGRCQARLHSGYHYPRSDSTALSAKAGAVEFRERFPEAIRTAEHHYVIAEDSKVSGPDYLAFLDRLGLPYEVVESPRVHHAQVTVRVPEAFVDVPVLRRLLKRDLRLAGVKVNFAHWADPQSLKGYDLIVVATYGQPWSRPLRYEVCEVALVELGHYQNQSFVVLDGDFVSLDPYNRTHMLYDVQHTVHSANVGYFPEIPEHLAPLLARPGAGPTKVSRVDDMLDSASRHLRMMGRHGQGVAIYHGSLFSVRAVLPDVDATDERPTLVKRDGNVLSILSGKICTAVTTARQVAEMAMVAA